VQGDRVAIVTGGGSGIGLAIARRLGSDGYPVAVFDLNAEAANTAAEGVNQQGGRAVGLVVDVADRNRVFSAVDEVRRDVGRPAILVNNAGMGAVSRKFVDTTLEMWEQTLRVNLTGPFNCCQAVLPDMIESRWGRIVNISSSSTHSGQALLGPYVASKSGLNGLTKTLALELGFRGITVNAIPPGFIDTPMLRESEQRGDFGPGGMEEAIARTPVRRAGLPDDIAATCAFLCLDEASYITGQIIGVNGGRNT
jgi:NAD(P)-dependent dehydrogenase (short-subunit alcohol dehydrogenase family)